jgi:hypothetical protein
MRRLIFDVMPDRDNNQRYQACWSGPDGDERYVWDVPEIMLDLLPFMAVRKLLAQGYDAGASLLIIRLQGSDRELCNASLGAVAATPLINHDAPVLAPTYCVYRDMRHDH